MGNVPLKEYFDERINRVEKSIDELANNHIAHLNAKFDKIIWLIITTLVALVLHAVGVYFNG